MSRLLFFRKENRARPIGWVRKVILIRHNVGGKRSFSANLKVEMTEKFGQNPAGIFLLTLVRRG